MDRNRPRRENNFRRENADSGQIIHRLERRVVQLEQGRREDRKVMKWLVACIKNRRGRPRVERRPRFSSTTIFTSTDTGSSASSSLPESTPSVTSLSAGPSSESSLSTGQQQPSVSSSIDSTPSAPMVDPQAPESEASESEVDEVENNSWATLTRISFDGDSDVDVILTALRKTAMERVKQWNPTKPEIAAKKAKIVKWILKPDNIHKFTTLRATFSTSRITSIWRGLVDELFPEIVNNADLIKYFGGASRATHFFGEFVQSVVSVHQRSCRKCALQ